LYSAVTLFRGWEIAFPLRGWMQPVVHNRSRVYKRRQKANRQWTARFRLESYQSLSGHNPTSATCYLFYAPGYRDSPFVAPWLDHNGDPSIRHQYPWSTYTRATWTFLLCAPLRLVYVYYRKMELVMF